MVGRGEAPEGGRARWAVRLDALAEGGEEARALVRGALPEAEAEACGKFKREEDADRALLSRILQRSLCASCCGADWADVDIRRTKVAPLRARTAPPSLRRRPRGLPDAPRCAPEGRKPYLSAPEAPAAMPNFNFNVSHEGDYVVLASEPVCVVGVDVAAPGEVRRRGRALGMGELAQSFGPQLTEREWAAVRACGRARGEDGQRDAFRRHWSCKEAFVKARGDGLGFPLGRCHFDFAGGPDRYEASVSVDGAERREWRLVVQRLGSHWVTTARGPPSQIVDAHGGFSATLRRKEFGAGEWQRELGAPSPPFALVGVAELLPSGVRDEFEGLLADPFL